MKRKITRGRLQKWSCTGKVAHKTWDLANYHANFLIAKGEQVHPYKCKFCDCYHVGHQPYFKKP